MKVIEEGKALKLKKLFSVHIAEDGTYFATRRHNPAFCFSGRTVEAVSARAHSALELHKEVKNKK
jgi:predicted RNase H-like HicB family nuclease